MCLFLLCGLHRVLLGAPSLGGDAFELEPLTTHGMSAHDVEHAPEGTFRTVFLSFGGVRGSDIGERFQPHFSRTSQTPPPVPGFTPPSSKWIQEVHACVQEDFAPFDVLVTTDKRVWEATPVAARTTVAFVAGNPLAGYIAFGFVGGFGDTRSEPTFVMPDLMLRSSKISCELASHTIGHTLGLHHDGTDDAEYYTGHGSGRHPYWSPIMGISDMAMVSQWSRAHYPGANQDEDDIAVMAAALRVRHDIGPDALISPSALPPPREHTLAPLSAHLIQYLTERSGWNLPWPPVGERAPDGVISSADDVDVVYFQVLPGWDAESSKSGPTRLLINSVQFANLNIQVEIYLLTPNNVTLLHSDSPPYSMDVRYSLPVGLGPCWVGLAITGVGDPERGPSLGFPDYGSLGQYSIHLVPPTPT